MEAAVESVYHKYFPEKLAGLTDSDFKSYVESYKKGLITPPTSESQEFSQFLDPVMSSADGQCFKLTDEMISYLDKTVTSKQVLIDAWDKLVEPSQGTRKK